MQASRSTAAELSELEDRVAAAASEVQQAESEVTQYPGLAEVRNGADWVGITGHLDLPCPGP